MKLSPEQQRAVAREGQDVCVVAGPGSGKTRVLTERFAWLVEERNVNPGRILAITFTEKAAIEIKQRLVKRFVTRPDIREAVERAWVATIHGFCARLLRENAIAAGLAPDFEVLDEAQATRMQRESAEAALDALFAERPAEMRRLLEAIDLSTSDGLRQDDLASALLKVYEAMRESGAREIPSVASQTDLWPDALETARALLGSPLGEWAAKFVRLDSSKLTLDHFRTLAEFEVNLTKVKLPAARRFKKEIQGKLESQWVEKWYADLEDLMRTALERVDLEYRARKRSAAVVDFSDLEEFAVRLLESDTEVRRETMARFDEVLMDELQDTNRVQWRLVELVKSRLYAVGDINQSIYGFRYADPQVFSEYRENIRGCGGEIDELRDNYRSRREILDAVGRMLDGQEGIEARDLIPCGTFAKTDGPIVERMWATGENSGAIEAGMVAARILELRAQGTFEFKDVAVLVRTLAAAEAFEEAFEKASIPFLVSGGRGFLEARETRDVLAFLAALVNVCDEIPLIGVLRGPLVGLSDEGIYNLGREGWRRVFEERFGVTRQMAGFVAPDRLLAQVFDECGYWSKLSDRARSNVDKLLAWLRREFRNRPRPLAELLEDLESLREAQSASDAPPPEAGDVVRIMTIHAAKGLEFPVVFVSALQRRPDSNTPSLLFSRTLGLGVKWRNPASDEGVSDSVHAQLKATEKAREKAESNRLLYVALTRAEQRLILTHAERRQQSPWEKLAVAALPLAIVTGEMPPFVTPMKAAKATTDVLLPPPGVVGQYDGSVSITSVSLFGACPRRYYLSRYLGLDPDSDEPGTGAMAMGLAVHAALAGKSIESEVAKALAARFEASEWGKRAAQAKRAEREFDFLFELDDVILRGQIDLWFEEGGELMLIDYKTDRDETSAGSYAMQLRLYALGLAKYAGRMPDRALLYYVRSDTTVEVSLADADIEMARQTVRRLQEAQEHCEFPLRPGSQCQKCLFFGGLCPEGREVGINSEGKNLNSVLFGPPSSFLVPASDGS
jgi:ATP-dependent exoDNAse (exonuclease V) beta subunit